VVCASKFYVGDGMIDASRLEILVVGNEFDSFYELARFLGCKYNKTATNSVKAVKKEFERYFVWERIGRSYRIRITEIYELVKPKVSRVVGLDHRNSLICSGVLKAGIRQKYIKSAEVVHNEEARKFIESMQSSSHRIEKIVVTFKEFFEELGIEFIYKLPDEALEALADDCDKQRIVKSSVSSVNEVARTALKNSLRSLKNKYLLEFYYGDIIQYRSDWILPCKEQQRLVNEAKATSLQSLGLPNSSRAYKCNKYGEYKRKAIAALPKDSHIVDFKPAYLIVFTPEQLRRYVTEHLGEVPENIDARQMLFSVMKQSLYEADVKAYEKAKEDALFADQAIAPEHKELCYDYLLQ
jgi:hypothetical protein